MSWRLQHKRKLSMSHSTAARKEKREARRTFREQTTQAVTVMMLHITRLEQVVYEPSFWVRLRRLFRGTPVPPGY